jgi:hypothetical protein
VIKLRSFLKLKVMLVSGVAVSVALGSGIAVAYWTSTGTGSVPAAVGTAGTLTLSGSVTSGIVPGGTEPVSFTASNPGTSGITVTSVQLVSVSVDAAHSACATADFSMATVTENISVAQGASNFALPTSGTLSYADTSANQNACEGATLTLALSSS